ncbi:MAG: hypothetical protein WD597_02970, partial [Balneolaceae bacterium]
KTKPIRIYELIGEENSPKKEEWEGFLEAYNQALVHYYSRNWEEAEEFFKKSKSLKTEDKLCEIYLRNIQEFKNNPPDKNWDGSYQQINK